MTKKTKTGRTMTAKQKIDENLTQKWHQLSDAASEIVEVLKQRALTVEEARTVLEATEAEIERQAVSAVRNTAIASAVMSVRPIRFR
jgi:predicted metal-binding transcription factor (methanogenesis marker protein 9)